MGVQSKKIRGDTTTRSSPTATTKIKDVWTTLLQISVWHALAEGRLHHRPHRTHHHRHRDHRQCGQVLTVRERGGLPGQRRLHRPHHQVLCLRRLLWHSLFRSPVHRSENETPVPSHLLDSHHPRLQYQVPLRLLCQRLDKLEDWVSISYLVFYTAVTLVVVAFTKECGTTSGGVVHDYGAPPAYKA